MGEEYEVFIKSSVRGYHAYFVDAFVTIGEVLACEREDNNAHDKYAIAVKNEAQLSVGYVPRELSKIFSRFLADFGDIEAECIGVRYNRGEGKGLEIPVDYRLTGNSNYLEKLVTSLKKREPTCHLDISNIRKWQI